MFNTTTVVNRNVKVSKHVSAVSGNIVKTYAESYFIRFHLKSPLAEKLLKDGASEVIIQMVMCGEMDVIAEVINRIKYNDIMAQEDSE